MEKTKIWVVYSLFGLMQSNLCFFLSEEDAEYYVYMKNKDSESKGMFFSRYLGTSTLEAGSIIKDKNFEKYLKEKKENDIKKLQSKIKEARDCSVEDSNKIEELTKKLNILTNK